MKFLSVDTSTRYSVVALSDEEGLIYGSRRLFEKGRSDGLIVLITRCLQKAKTKIEKIDYFGIGVGPGSFTGLRIGLSTVKAFSFALHKPCLVFSSLDAIAFNEAAVNKKKLCVIVDAKRSNVYCRFYKMDTQKRTSPDLLLSLAALEKRIEADTAICGDGLPLYKREIQKRPDVQSIPEKFWYPTPASLSRLTQEAYETNKSVDCFKLSAVYLYERDCQVRSKIVQGAA